ncbi:MAG: hypothetical protein ACI8W3_003201 [Myxococcota bacterium]|jgi:hypothetical protein
MPYPISENRPLPTAYETVIDPSNLVFTAVAMLIHAAALAAQLGLASFLIVTGLVNMVLPGFGASWYQKMGAIQIVRGAAERLGVVRLALGVALLLPALLGAPYLLSLLACVAAIALFRFLERGLPADSASIGRLARRTMLLAAVLLPAFMLYEGDDSLDLGVELLATMQEWRTHELDWQLANDLQAPKVGELAPDFELQDPAGATAVRLSDFRGKRPVALIFGSYT